MIGATRVDGFYNDSLSHKETFKSHLRSNTTRIKNGSNHYRHSTGPQLVGNPPLLDARKMDHGGGIKKNDYSPSKANYDEMELIWTKNPLTLEPSSSFENVTLPPPARITPFSGVPQTKDMDELIRPIAYRPTMTPPKEPVSYLSPNSGLELGNSSSFFNRLSLPNKANSDTTYSTSFKHLPNYSELPNRQRNSTSGQIDSDINAALRPNELPLGRPKPVYQPSPTLTSETSSETPSVNNGALKRKEKDDDYDLVPEFIDLLKQHLGPELDFDSKRSNPPSQIQMSSPGKQRMMTTAERSPMIRPRHEHQSSYGSRQSSGIHVTPSPSDSGVAEMEAVLREKETELNSLRSTMEANEEIIVRVYQEKEERWLEKLREMNGRMQKATGNEQKMMAQIHQIIEEKNQLHAMVQNLTAEKQGLQRKCKEIEHDMFEYKEKLEAIEHNYTLCRQCGTVFRPPSNNSHESAFKRPDSLNSSCSSAFQGVHPPNRSEVKRGTPSEVLFLQVLDTEVPATTSPQNNNKKPIPPPRPSKSPTPQIELRGEIDTLRCEVMNLKDSMEKQISQFTDERRRWDDEKEKVIQYQKLLQTNFVHVTKRNHQLEQQLKPHEK